MRKLFLFSALAAFAILGCNGSGDMPCVDCEEPFPTPPSSQSSPSVQSSSSGQQIWNGEEEISSSSSDEPGRSSPSEASSSSKQSGVIYDTSVVIGGETYETVVIGTQTWTARNLNLYNNFDDNPNGCGIYYDWATAMALDASCNSSTCASKVSANHRGICPEGWHIPSDYDWNILAKTVGDSRYLKAVSDWWNGSGKRDDKYGFAALPCGYTNEIEFLGFGDFGGWWSSTDVIDKGSAAHLWSVNSKDDDASLFHEPKSFGHNVRCVKN